MRGDVFISIGTPFTEKQSEFKAALLNSVRMHGLNPRIIDETDFLASQPLKGIASVLSKCSGAIIVAYERLYVDSGIERRLSQKERSINSAVYSTPWNQIEAAMAYVYGMPLLVICEENLRQEGLLEEKFDWIVEKTGINAASVMDGRLQGRLASWAVEVERYAVAKNSAQTSPTQIVDSDTFVKNLKNTSLAKILGALTLQHIVPLGSALAAIFGAGFAIGKFLAK